MKRILFIDHSFHLRTNSSRFFVEILEGSFDVEVVHVEPKARFPMEVLQKAETADAVVLWQMDYLAPVFLAAGLPTVVVPMYDGSSIMPDLHWIWAKKARFINFSFSLHHRILSCGGGSLLLKYFKPPVPKEKKAKFNDGLNVFIWHRAPHHGVNMRVVEEILGEQINSIHVHDAVDDETIDGSSYIRRDPALSYSLTVSHWFDSQKEYEAQLDSANVFFAPRLAEGIGMALLEAMSRGMLVFANDLPTNNEYVSNFINGILFNSAKVGRTHIQNPSDIGHLAWQTVVEGYAQWQAAALTIPEFIRSTTRPEPANISDLAGFADGLTKAYYSGLASYQNYLVTQSKMIAKMSGEDLQGRVNAHANLDPLPPTRMNGHLSNDETPRALWLESNNLFPADRQRHLTSGSIVLDGNWVWIAGVAATFAFHIDPSVAMFQSLVLEFHHPTDYETPTKLVISLNDIILHIGDLDVSVNRVQLSLPTNSLRADNLLRFQLSGPALTSGAHRSGSVCLKGAWFE